MTIGQFAEKLNSTMTVRIDGVEMRLSAESALALADTLGRVRSADEEVLALVGAGHDWYVATASHVFRISFESNTSSAHQVTLDGWPRHALRWLRTTTHYTSQMRGAGTVAVFLKSAELICDGLSRDGKPLTLRGEAPDNGPAPEDVLRFAQALGRLPAVI